MRNDAGLAARFWSKVHKTPGCWLWTATRSQSGKGYGSLWWRGKLWPAHRISWLLNVGPVPPDLPLILHSCDNPACVRPSHLYAGTVKTNALDASRRGRITWRKLSDERVRALRAMASQGVSSSQLAAAFGITSGHARKVRAGKALSHVS